MTPELQHYYEDRFSMFATPGWLALIEDVTSMEKVADSLNGITDEKSLHFSRGELSIMRWILNLKAMSEKAYVELENDTE